MSPPDPTQICLQCRKRNKRKNYQFCSRQCTTKAASKAPQLLKVPKGHVMYEDVKNAFQRNWHASNGSKAPKIVSIYLLSWTAALRTQFDRYRDEYVAPRSQGSKEVKRFRSETRCCRLGDPGQSDKPCNNDQCRLCLAIKTGFLSSLEYKQRLASQGILQSSRFGVGIYMAPSSSKAYDYAINDGPGSERYRAIFSVRVALGKSEIITQEDYRRKSPAPGYDSVEVRPSDGGPTELVVFNHLAVMPAYMIIVDTNS